ncbi:hypothetical protein Peur_033848 [Populus x canadensis]
MGAIPILIFAGTFSEKLTRTVRQFSPHLAAKMRPPLTQVLLPVIRERPSTKRAIYTCWVFVMVFSSDTLILSPLYILHASFRTPNLKARLKTFREVW